MPDAHAKVGKAARRAVRRLALLVLRAGAVREAARHLQLREQRREVGLSPLLALLLCVVLAARQHLAVVPRSKSVLHLARLVQRDDVLVEGVVEPRVALVARVAKVHVRAQHDLLLNLGDALGVGDDLPSEALGILLADHLLDKGRHPAHRRRVLHDRDADRAHVGLLA
eukprot:7391035-Prymnesium_polylepis.1